MELPGADGPLPDGQLFIQHHLRVYFLFRTETGTGRTGAVRTVATETPGGNPPRADAAVDAGELLREHQFLAAFNGHQRHPRPQLQSRLDRVGNASLLP